MFIASWKDLFCKKSKQMYKIKENIENIKKELKNSFDGNNFWKANTKKGLILLIRLEHLQIYKHQKIAMKYLQKLEDKLK